MASESQTQNNQTVRNSYCLSSSDHPGMVLTNKQFNGGNYTNWSNAARIGPGTKLKPGFVDGTIPKPDEALPDLQKWLTYDYMVRCWLLISLEPETFECFMYVKSTKELWDELAERCVRQMTH